ncbi:MAG: hypothetical protein O2854_03975 [Chloroflexi bacterium]|nr:hypothetical protein [Chloroflexota bacterium]
MPPRTTFTRLTDGMTLGHPHDNEQQRRILEATLGLLGNDAPVRPLKLDEK